MEASAKNEEIAITIANLFAENNYSVEQATDVLRFVGKILCKMSTVIEVKSIDEITT